MKSIVFIHFFLISIQSFGQVFLERQVIATAGFEYGGSFGSISSTVGEVIIDTKLNTSVVLTQGFQQTQMSNATVNTKENTAKKLNFIIYPNPTDDVFYIEFENPIDVAAKVVLYNSVGVETSNISVKIKNENSISVKVSDYARGSYFLIIKNTDNELIGTQKVLIR
jgi:hypothetical protein